MFINPYPFYSIKLTEITLVSEAPGYYSDTTGYWVEGVETVSTFKGIVQPVSDEVLMNLPQGTRISDSVMVYTRTPIPVGNPLTLKDTDRLRIEGITYRVFDVAHWKTGHLNHQEVSAIRENEIQS